MVVNRNYSVLLSGPQLPSSALVAEKLPGGHKPKGVALLQYTIHRNMCWVHMAMGCKLTTPGHKKKVSQCSTF